MLQQRIASWPGSVNSVDASDFLTLIDQESKDSEAAREVFLEEMTSDDAAESGIVLRVFIQDTRD